MRELLVPLTSMALLGLPMPAVAKASPPPRRAASPAASRAAGRRDPSGSDDDKNNTVETRLLKILKDRGVLSEKEFAELRDLGAQLRSEDLRTNAAVEKEIADLAESLRQQSQEAKKSSEDAVKFSYKQGKGVTFAYGENFAMTMGGAIQARFSGIQADGPTSAGQEDRASFDIRRLRIWWEGYTFTKDLEYKVQVDFAVNNSILRDAYINYRFAPEFQARLGQMKRPFSRQQWTSATQLEFVERASAVERFRSGQAGDRDVGAMLWGEANEKKLEWYAGVYNGDGLNNGTPNPDNLGPASSGLNVANQSNNDSNGLEAVLRLVYNPFGPVGYSEGDLERSVEPKLGIGIQYAYNPERRGNPMLIPPGPGGIPAGELPQYIIQTAGFDMAFRYAGLFATGEYYWRSINPSGALADNPQSFGYSTESGYFGQVGYFFGEEKNKGLELAGRISVLNFDNEITLVDASTGIHDYSAGATYYFAGHNVKVAMTYTYRANSYRGTKETEQDQIVQFQVQVKF